MSINPVQLPPPCEVQERSLMIDESIEGFQCAYGELRLALGDRPIHPSLVDRDYQDTVYTT